MKLSANGWSYLCLRVTKLRVRLVQPQKRGGRLLAQRYRKRTPAMAVGRTHRRWTAREVLSCPLPKVSA
jgi:hypothetical protein